MPRKEAMRPDEQTRGKEEKEEKFEKTGRTRRREITQSQLHPEITWSKPSSISMPILTPWVCQAVVETKGKGALS